MGRILVLAAVLAPLLLIGCSPQERAGVSPLPQNRPADWELRPYNMPRT